MIRLLRTQHSNINKKINENDEVRKRLQKRDAKTSFLNLRLKNAEEEMKMADQYDHQIINDNFETSYAQFRKIIEDIITSSHKKEN